MPGLLQLLIASMLGLALSGAPVAAQDIRIEPIPPHVKPQWTPVPNVSGVYYAPNLPTDVFRRGSKYYFYWQGYLYRGSKPKGPWKSVTKIPAWFSEIDPSLFKTAASGPGGPPAGPPGGLAPMPPTPPGPGTPPGPAEGLAPATPAPAPASPEATPPAAPVPSPEKSGEPPVPSEPGQGPKVM
jgi:hypothetical protein